MSSMTKMMTQKDSGVSNMFFDLVSLSGVKSETHQRFSHLHQKLSNIVKQRADQGLNNPQEIKSYFEELGCEVLSGNWEAYNHSCIGIDKGKVYINVSWTLDEGRLNTSTRKSVFISIPSELAEKILTVGLP